MAGTNYIAKNLQVLCWLGIKKHLVYTPSEYLKCLSENTRIPEDALRKILAGTAIPSSEELSRLCMFFTGQESIEGIEDRYLFADIVEMHSAAPNGSWCGVQRQLSAANGIPKSGCR